ncbi:MAG: hypothetical protein AAGN82_20825 [Myxococcota bacterium]
MGTLGGQRTTAWLLRVAAACTFFGAAWQHLRWDAPFWALAFNERLLEGAVGALLGMTWHEYATSPTVERTIVGIVKAHGLLYAASGVAALLPSPSHGRRRRAQRGVLSVGAGLLFFLSWLYFLDHNRQVGALLERTSQWAAPALLVGWLRGAQPEGRFRALLSMAIALTFFGHGLYAVGFYEVPGAFVTMIMNGLGVGEPTAVTLLHAAGVLDLVIAGVVLLAPKLPRRLVLSTLAWAVAWGALTTLARVWSNVSWTFFEETVAQWLHEAVLRFPHAVLPLVLFLSVRRRTRPTDDANPTPTTPQTSKALCLS